MKTVSTAWVAGSNRLTFYKTLFARMGNIKAGKYVSDDGEDLNDTEKVLKKNGILLRDSTNEFRNFGSVLDEVASKWQNFDSVTQHAIATAFAGTRQQEKFFVLMENYGTALEYEAVAAESAGTANKKYTEAYLDSIEARKNALTAAYESLSQTVLNSEVVKDFYSALTVVVTIIENIAKSGVGAVVAVELLYAAFIKLAKACVSGTGVFTLFNATLVNSTGLTWAESVANVGLLGTIKAVTKALWEQVTAWIAAGGWIAIVIAAVAALTVVLIKLIKQPAKIREESIQALKDIRSELSTTKSELEELENKIKDIRDRIAEIKANPLKDIADINELERLERQLSNLEDRLVRAEEKNKRLKQDEYRQFLNNTKSGYINLDYSVDILSQEDVFATNSFLLGEMRRYAKEEGQTPEQLKESFRFYGQVAQWIGDLDTALGDLTYIENPTNDLEKSVNERIKQIYSIFDEWDALFNPDGLFERILNRPYYSDAKSALGKVASEDDLETLYDSNAQVKAFLDYIVQLYGLNLEDGGFSYIFNSLNKIGEASSKTVEKIETLFDTLNSDTFKKTTSAVSELSSAIEEMDTSGRISLDTAQKLAELGEEYVDAIMVENGAIKVNSDLLRALAIEELKVAKATAIRNGATSETIKLYDKLIEDATKVGSGGYLDRALSLRNYENTVLEFAGGADYDRRRLQNYYKSMEDIRKEIEYLRSNGASFDDPDLMKRYEDYINYANKWLALQKEIYEGDDDLYKSSIEKQNEALDKQKDLLEKIYDERKKALQLTKDENSYQKELASKQKKVADLQTQLITARLDTSASGRARVRALESELQKAQEELDDFNLEHAIAIVSDKLDAEKEENESIYERQKADNEKLLEEYLANSKAEYEDLKTKLLEEYGIVNDALGDLNGDNGVVKELEGIEGTIQKIEEKIGKDNIGDLPLEMHYATGREISGERKSDAYWDYKNKQVYGVIEKHHSGGIVGDLKLKDNETFAKLLKGEYVATPEQMSRFLNSTLPNLSKPKGYPEFSGSLVTINVESVNSETMPKLEALVKRAADKIKSDITSAFDKTGYRGTTKKVLSY